MGNISSKPDEAAALYLRDQTRCGSRDCRTLVYSLSNAHLVTIALLTITNSSRNVLLNITPNAFPAVRCAAKRDMADDTPVSYVQVSKDRAQFLGSQRQWLSVVDRIPTQQLPPSFYS
jgi:Arf-GAP with SH3 domain, ANK repeat and PH domain-containing protein